MRTSNIDFSKILKRKMAINSTYDEGVDSFHMYNIAKKSLNENSSTFNKDVEVFFNSSKNSKNANKYYSNCLSLIESIDDNCIIKDRIVSVFSEEIIPYIKNLNSLKESINFSNIDNDSKSILLNSIKENKICDRILSNDMMIKKRFNIENFINNNRYLPLENIIFECCSLLDTYSDIPIYGKMNIALEQLSFYLQKQDVEYNKAKFVELVTEYFLYRNDTIDKDIKNKYKNILKENIMISDNDLINVKYFVEEDNFSCSDNIQKLICNFNNSINKDLSEFKLEIQELFEEDPKNMINKFGYILEILRHLIMIGTFNHIQIQDIIEYITAKSIETRMSSEDINKLIEVFNIELQLLDKQIYILSTNTTELQKYSDCISMYIEYLNEYLYRTSNIDYKNIDNSSKDNISTLQEFKLFKFDNLIKATLKIDKFLRKKSIKITDNIRTKAKNIFKATKDFFNENLTEEDILKMGIITENDNVDICIAIFEIYEEEVKEVNSLMESFCKLLENHVIENDKDMNIYYTNIDNIFELHLESNVILTLNEQEEEIRNNSISTRDMFYMEKIISVSECLEKLSNINIDNMVQSCINTIKSSSDIESLEEIIKLFSYTNVLSYKDIIYLKEIYSDIYPNNYLSNTILNSVVEEYWNDNRYDVSLEVQTEALVAIERVLAEDAENEEEKTITKSSSRSIENKINNLKLYSMSIKKKAKDLSSKEKELSRNLDATVNTLYKSMKQAVVSDRREAIIKGSIIPSFSKLIKIAIGLAGTAVIFGPIYSIIAIVAGLAASKHLTYKERCLLLDEIEIEMKVVDKEIQMAENNNNMKKYRELMTFKKKLQREHSRIRYGLKSGTDLPDNPTNDY